MMERITTEQKQLLKLWRRVAPDLQQALYNTLLAAAQSRPALTILEGGKQDARTGDT